MRITKVNGIKHFKDEKYGILKKNNTKFKILLPERKEAMKKSFKGQLLKTERKKPKYYDYIDSFIDYILTEKKEWNDFYRYKRDNPSEEEISKLLHPKGREKPYNILELMIKIKKCENNQELNEQCKETISYIKKRMKNKIKYLEKSIKNNYIFSINENNEIKYHSKKSEFLGKSMEKVLIEEDYEIFVQKIRELEKEFDLKKLIETINSSKEDFDEKDRNFKIKQILQSHTSEKIDLLKSNDELSVYNNEVKKYFEHYFPVSRKGHSRKKHDQTENVDYLLKENTIKKTIENQLINALTQHMLKIGKFIYYYTSYSDNGNWNWNKTKFTSEELDVIKKEETFSKKIINACVFATNNFKNIYNPDETGDILLKKDDYFNRLMHDQNKTNNILKRLKHFLTIGYNKTDLNNELDDILNDENLLDLTKELHTSIYTPRNNIYHLKNHLNDNMDYIFKKKESEEPNINNLLLKKIFNIEVKNVKNNFAEKIRSSKILEVYKKQDIISLFSAENIILNFHRSNVPYAPSFKKVWDRGKNSRKNDWFKEKQDNENSQKVKDENSGKRNLMKIIYYNIFQNNFTKSINRQEFKEVVNQVRNENKKNSSNDSWAYEQTHEFKNEDEIHVYLANVQSRIINSNIKDEDKKNYFSRFLLDIFMEGFFRYCEKNKKNFEFILFPKKEDYESTVLDKVEKELSEFIKTNSEEFSKIKYHHIYFYGLLKLNNSKTISNLRNEIIKYEKAVGKELPVYHSIIELVSLSSDRFLNFDDKINPELYKNQQIFKKYYSNDEEWEKYLSSFVNLEEIENNTLENEDLIYFQYSSNQKIPILIKHIENIRKNGTYNILSKIYNERITSDDLKLYKTRSENIEELQRKRQLLHDKWIKCTKNKNKLDDEDKKSYMKKIEDIEKYNHCSNKVKLVDLSRIQQLLIEILGKIIGYASSWERDFFFFLLTVIYIKKLQNPQEYIYSGNKVSEIFEEGGIGRKYNIFRKFSPSLNILHNNIICPLFFKLDKNCRSHDVIKIRNSIDHLDYLNKNENRRSLLKFLKCLRDMLSYDRKLRNSVTKSFIQIFKRNNIHINLKMDENHDFELKDIKSDTVKHLKNENITNNIYSNEYISLVENLIKYE